MGSDYRQEFQTAFDVSRETMDRLDSYAALVKKWNPAINLISKSTVDALWQRHFHDSAQIYQLRQNQPCHWVDLGSGGGFPALVLSILSLEFSPKDRFTLVESDLRKSVFLQTVIRELDLNAVAIADRIEKISALDADILTARALSSLDKLMGFAELHLNPSGFAIFPKGETYKKEIEDAVVSWTFELEEITSETNSSGAILKIGDIARV